MYIRNMLLTVERFSTGNNSKQVTVQPLKNLINPSINDPIAFGYYFPRQWNINKIYQVLDPTRKQILQIKIVQNKLGRSTGKILFTFKNLQVMNKYVNRYNEDFIQTQDTVQRIVIKRFELKNQIKKKQKQEYSRKYGVSLVNLDFDIDKAELQRLAQDFGKIQYIQLPLKDNGLNRGSSKIYFKTRQGMVQFQQFSDGLKYKERKLKSSVIKTQSQLNKQKIVKQIMNPKIVMKWNQDLYKRMVKKQFSESNQEKGQQIHENKVY